MVKLVTAFHSAWSAQRSGETHAYNKIAWIDLEREVLSFSRDMDALVAVLETLCKLRAIKWKIEHRVATPEEKQFYRENKLGAWIAAENLLAKYRP